ncbi:Pentatricopeptide repeat-containing protein [Apostasia shenzhenica]|uniref:Pentatricopeptide repeat-containing protein n=1 Tax=Apostasia shenzhenica TaxID=1088818 RepID=A0A2I0ACQ5_9ASPA|nr:Pentatricopeptide repeat-containing protein [Apostasia shenzhenica]
MRHVSSYNPSILPWESAFSETSLRKLEAALDNDCVEDAWEVFCDYKCLHGLPKRDLVRKMISLMACSSSTQWLHKAYDLVLVVFRERPDILHSEGLIRLSLILARSQMPVLCSTIFRIVFENFKIPSDDLLCTIFCHLVKSEIGSYLASNILVEICESSQACKPVVRKSIQLKPMIHNATIFNLILDSCSKYGCFLKAQLIIELMSKFGVTADVNTITILAQLYENIGQRAELMRLRVHIDRVAPLSFKRHYCQFYDSLLSLHFKYNDIDSAAELMLELYRNSKSSIYGDILITANNGLRNACLVQIGSDNLKTGHKLKIDPWHLDSNFIVDSQSYSGLALFTDGKIIPSTKALAKLIHGYVKQSNVIELSNFIIEVEKVMGSTEGCFSDSVIDACIQLGYLEIAHDILDDLESADIHVGVNIYTSLLRAYCKENMLEESKMLLNQMRKVGLLGKLSNADAISSNLCSNCNGNSFGTKTDWSEGRSLLAGYLSKEIKEDDSTHPLVYEFNSSILFFCKANMMEDAIMTVKRMQKKNMQPTIETYSHLLSGYSSLKMYRQITILWGDIKRRLEEGVLHVDRDLFECLLMNFLRGGYFERVMEIADYMIKRNIFADKWKYKKEFLKLHQNLYRNLKAIHTKTDAQRKRLEYVQAFRKWVGIHTKGKNV